MIWIEDESNGLKKDEKCRDMWNEYSICIRVVISGKKFELLPYLLLANLKLTSFKCVQTMMIAFTVLDTYTSVCEKEFNEIKLEYNYFASSTTWEISFFCKEVGTNGSISCLNDLAAFRVDCINQGRFQFMHIKSTKRLRWHC